MGLGNTYSLNGMNPQSSRLTATALNLICRWDNLINHSHYLYLKKTLPLFNLTQEQRAPIEKRFNKHKKCTDLTITHMPSRLKLGAAAAVKMSESRCILLLPDYFFKQDWRIQVGHIAHEATHFSQNHQAQLTHFAAHSFITKLSELPFNNPRQLVLALKNKEREFELDPLTKKLFALEDEADLLQKTPEELLGLIRYDQVRWKKIHHILSAQDREAYFKRPVRFDLADQFEKQILNPGVDDIPTSSEECKEALRHYFEKEEDYQKKTPNIDHPLVFKRVDFLRAKLIEFEKNSELSTNS